MPKFPIRYLDKIEVPGALYANCSFRQLPSTSVNFRGVPFPHVLCNFDNMLDGGWRMPNVLTRYLAKIAVLSAAYPNFSFRQRPRRAVSTCLV